MKKNKLVLCVRILSALCGLLLVALVAGCGGDTSSTATRANNGYLPATADIGAAGGTVTADSAYGLVRLTVPTGALTASTTITVTPIEVTALSPLLPLTAQFLAAAKFEPSVTTFASGKPATVSFPLPTARMAGGGLYLLTYDETTQRWGLGTTATVSADGLSATATVEHFSTYALSALPQGTAELTFANQAHPGFGLSTGSVFASAFTAPSGDVDFMLEPWYSGATPAPAMVPVGTGVVIQDMGAVSIWTVTEVPDSIANPTTPYTPVLGHTYAIKTAEGNYGLIYCKSITITAQTSSYDCVFVYDWVYQPNGTRSF